jgi:hypothetical protein
MRMSWSGTSEIVVSDADTNDLLAVIDNEKIITRNGIKASRN